MIKLNPISSNKLINYSTGNYEEIKSFRHEDLIIEHELATLHSAFALRFCNDKENGVFVEIGTADWKTNNNTYFLEKEFGWTGVAIDIEKKFTDKYNENRRSHCINADAMSYNWDKYFEENNFPERIDYLQIDIDKTPRYANLFALLNLPLARYRFSTITIEHNAGMDPSLNDMKNIQKDILFSYGYKLVAEGFTDDWWIDSKLNISESQFNSITYSAWNRRLGI